MWSGNGMRLPGVVAYSSALALPYSARHTGWAAEDCVESFVGDHTDVRLLQNFWSDHVHHDPSNIWLRMTLLQEIADVSLSFAHLYHYHLCIDSDRYWAGLTRHCLMTHASRK